MIPTGSAKREINGDMSRQYDLNEKFRNMTQLTPEQKAYKEKTINQLRTNFSLLEAKIGREKRPEVIDSQREQLEEMQAHINHLQQELAANVAGEPVADELFRRIASALTKQKFYLAKKLISKLETIEPFYPEIERLQQEAEVGRASRRTRSVAQGGALPEIVLSPDLVRAITNQPGGQTVEVVEGVVAAREKVGFARLFEFHIVMSCLVVTLIFCVMSSVGGVTVLQWLVEGN